MLSGDSGAAEKLQAAIAEVRAAENRLEEVSLALNCAEQENMQLQQRLAHTLAEQKQFRKHPLRQPLWKPRMEAACQSVT